MVYQFDYAIPEATERKTDGREPWETIEFWQNRPRFWHLPDGAANLTIGKEIRMRNDRGEVTVRRVASRNPGADGAIWARMVDAEGRYGGSLCERQADEQELARESAEEPAKRIQTVKKKVQVAAAVTHPKREEPKPEKQSKGKASGTPARTTDVQMDLFGATKKESGTL